MSHFYGYLKGSRGTATRCGGKGTGINAHIRSWNNDIHADLINNTADNCDQLNLTIPTGLKTIINHKEYVVTDEGLKEVGE